MEHKKSTIYTGGGDKGTTSLVGGFRVPKTHFRIEAYGGVDELNSFIGLLMEEMTDSREREYLLSVQSKLFTVGAYLATDPTKTEYRANSHITGESIDSMERMIDEIDGSLPKMKAFVLPGGSRAAALAHVCRTVCRRAERAIYRMAEMEPESVEEMIFIFINRLSDLLFVIARRECLLKKSEEIFWEDDRK